jgi:hypothetical protein
MANHLMGGHAAPTPLAVGAHLAQAIQHFLLVAIIQESSQSVGCAFYILLAITRRAACALASRARFRRRQDEEAAASTAGGFVGIPKNILEWSSSRRFCK